MWRRIDLMWTDVSDERIVSIFRVEKSVSRWLQTESPVFPIGDSVCSLRWTHASSHVTTIQRTIPSPLTLPTEKFWNLNWHRRLQKTVWASTVRCLLNSTSLERTVWCQHYQYWWQFQTLIRSLLFFNYSLWAHQPALSHHRLQIFT
jgi:hypothetical protein